MKLIIFTVLINYSILNIDNVSFKIPFKGFLLVNYIKIIFETLKSNFLSEIYLFQMTYFIHNNVLHFVEYT